LSFEKKFPDIESKKDAKLLQAKLFLRNNEIDKGLDLIDEVFQIQDSITKLKTEKIYSEAASKYNYEDALSKLKINQEIIDQKDKANKILVILIISVFIAAVVFIILFRKSKHDNQLIKHQKSELAKGIVEKENLLDEMHHRTKNNLQIVGGILELQSQKNIQPEAFELLKESQQYLESISLIHKMLYDESGFENVNLQSYFKSLTELIIGNHPKKNIEVNISCQDVELPVNLTTSIGLIFSELITNSLKHAFNNHGMINIEHHLNKNEHHLIYKDNGQGFGMEHTNRNEGTGLKLIRSLAEDSEGQIQFLNNQGFQFELKFKHDKNER
jgi:two-component sensor histidine kinase